MPHRIFSFSCVAVYTLLSFAPVLSAFGRYNTRVGGDGTTSRPVNGEATRAAKRYWARASLITSNELYKRSYNLPHSSENRQQFTILLGRDGSKFRNFEEFLLQQVDDDNDDDDQDRKSNGTKPLVVVVFTSPYCGPCLKIKDELVVVNQKLKERITLVAIDSDKVRKM